MRERKQPSYLALLESGELDRRIDALYELLSPCRLCPRECGVDRLRDERGFCRTGLNPVVSSYGPHFGEESPLVGYGGSGTIFLTHCNLACLYCQNYEISQLGEGREVSIEDLADMMLHLQRMGCHNINFVTPTHVVPQIVKAVKVAAERGLKVPLVYNCGGYESVRTLRLLEGIFDIYMPDFKYSDDKVAEELSRAPGYFEVAKSALKEMHRQVGDLVIDDRGIAVKGLLVRHLVLPNGLAGTEKVMKFIAEEISKNTYVNVMAQYRPCHKAFSHPLLSRPITSSEYREAVEIALKCGLERLDHLVAPRRRFILF
ncbi:MAG TPA: radical SAM protein [Armatimonadetes bacterium]|nr:radical SAM protein [Armatimonadota bacterium]